MRDDDHAASERRRVRREWIQWGVTLGAILVVAAGLYALAWFTG